MAKITEPVSNRAGTQTQGSCFQTPSEHALVNMRPRQSSGTGLEALLHAEPAFNPSLGALEPSAQHINHRPSIGADMWMWTFLTVHSCWSSTGGSVSMTWATQNVAKLPLTVLSQSQDWFQTHMNADGGWVRRFGALKYQYLNMNVLEKRVTRSSPVTRSWVIGSHRLASVAQWCQGSGFPSLLWVSWVSPLGSLTASTTVSPSCT